MATLNDLRQYVEIPEHLVAGAEIPVHTGLQIQGDVAIIPVRSSAKKGVAIPADGIPVVRGENGGNTHLLVGDGTWAPVETRGLDLGVLTVLKDKVAYLLHPEHGGNAMGPGCYLFRRQREMADEIRMVAD